MNLSDLSLDITVLQEIIDQLQNSDFETLGYLGKTYSIWSGCENEGEIAEWHCSTWYNGADIYLSKEIPEKYKRFILFHEILEAYLALQEKFPTIQAHETAVKYDAEYAKASLTKNDYKKYESFRKKQKRLRGKTK